MKITRNGSTFDITPKKMRELIILSRGNESKAAIAAGFASRSDWCHFKTNHTEFREACDRTSIREEILDRWADVGESNLVKAAKAGDFRAIEKILDDQCPDRGWGSHKRELARLRASAPSEAAGSGRDLVALFKRPVADEDEAEKPAEGSADD